MLRYCCVHRLLTTNMYNAVWTLLILLTLLPESTPRSLLLATNTGVHIFTADNATTATIHPHNSTAVQYRYDKRDVYFVSDSRLWYSYYRNSLNEYEYEDAVPLRRFPDPNIREAFVLDWVSYTLYFTNSSSSTVCKTGLLGADFAVVYSSTERWDQPPLLELDPFDRTLLVVHKNGTLLTISLHRNHSEVKAINLTLRGKPLGNVWTTSYDPAKQVLVAIVHGVDDVWSLVQYEVKKNYTETKFSIGSAELATPSALDVLNDDLVWVIRDEEGSSTIFTCKVHRTCDARHLDIVAHPFEVIYDVKFYSAYERSYMVDRACAELNCSHGCADVSSYNVLCDCPQGMVIGGDERTCQEEPPSLPWTQELVKALSSFLEALYHWINLHLKTITYISCGAAVVVLLACMLCLLNCSRKPKESRKKSNSYDMINRRGVPRQISYL